MTDIIAFTPETIKNQIYTIRGEQVMMDRDLAVLYGVETRVLNQAVKRNIERFPDDFMFRLTDLEFRNWVSQSVIPNNEKMGLRILSHAFTEQGIAMLSSTLRSEVSVSVSIQIIRAFVEMRKLINSREKIPPDY